MKSLLPLKIFTLIFYTAVIIASCYCVMVPRVLESRAMDLDLLRYDSKKDNFVLKDSVVLGEYDFKYLKLGDMSK